jgi:hypothetical protein
MAPPMDDEKTARNREQHQLDIARTLAFLNLNRGVVERILVREFEAPDAEAASCSFDLMCAVLLRIAMRLQIDEARNLGEDLQ